MAANSIPTFEGVTKEMVKVFANTPFPKVLSGNPSYQVGIVQQINSVKSTGVLKSTSGETVFFFLSALKNLSNDEVLVQTGTKVKFIVKQGGAPDRPKAAAVLVSDTDDLEVLGASGFTNEPKLQMDFTAPEFVPNVPKFNAPIPTGSSFQVDPATGALTVFANSTLDNSLWEKVPCSGQIVSLSTSKCAGCIKPDSPLPMGYKGNTVFFSFEALKNIVDTDIIVKNKVKVDFILDDTSFDIPRAVAVFVIPDENDPDQPSFNATPEPTETFVTDPTTGTVCVFPTHIKGGVKWQQKGSLSGQIISFNSAKSLGSIKPDTMLPAGYQGSTVFFFFSSFKNLTSSDVFVENKAKVEFILDEKSKERPKAVAIFVKENSTDGTRVSNNPEANKFSIEHNGTITLFGAGKMKNIDPANKSIQSGSIFKLHCAKGLGFITLDQEIESFEKTDVFFYFSALKNFSTSTISLGPNSKVKLILDTKKTEKPTAFCVLVDDSSDGNMEVVLPSCKHKVWKKSYEDQITMACPMTCQEELKCKTHSCPQPCGVPHRHKCQAQVFVKAKCGHPVPVTCENYCPGEVIDVVCQGPCGRRRNCGHPCPLQCGQNCESIVCQTCILQMETIQMEANEKSLATTTKKIERMKLSPRTEVILTLLPNTGQSLMEYQHIENMLRKNTQKVLKIEKITNAYLEEQFYETKSTAFDQKTDFRFHGADKITIQDIIRNGFNLPPVSNIPYMFGRGILFVSDSSKIAVDIYTKGSQQLLLCEVLVGKSLRVSQAAPSLDLETLNGQAFDSVMAPNHDLIIYNPCQAIPRYIIHYRSSTAAPTKLRRPVNID